MSHAPASVSNTGARGPGVLDAPTAVAVFATRAGRLPLVIGLYAIAAVVVTFPLVLHLADGLPAAPDTLLHSWILAWDIHALTTNPLHLYDANIYYPFPLSLTYSDAMLSGALTIAPILLLTGNAVLAHNVLTLVSLVIAGLGMYLLVRALTANEIGALVAGSIFAFCASRQAHLEHVNLLQFGWLPLALLYLHRAVARGRRSDYLLFALFTACQALASVYLAWMMAIAYVIFLAVELASRRTAWKIGNMARIAGALLLAACVVIPVMWPYEQMQQIYDFQWPTDVIGALSAVPTDYLSVPPRNVLYAGVLAQFSAVNFPTEHILFPGFVALALALVGLFRRSLSVEVVRYSLMAAVGLILSFGPFLRLDDGPTVISLRYGYLLQFLPGFAVMRVPARFDFLLMLGLSVLAGIGVTRLSAALARSTPPRIHRSILALVVGLALLELVQRPQSVPPISVGAVIPPVYSWLRAQDPTSVVAEIPTKGPTRFASFGYEFMSTYHWHPLVNGDSGFEPPAARPIADQLDAFPDPTAVANLQSLGVRYLVAHLDDLDQTQTQRLDAANLTGLQVAIAATFGRDIVYELAPLPGAPPFQDHVNLELPGVVGRGAPPAVSVTVTNDSPYPLVTAAPQAVTVHVEWNNDGQATSAKQDLPVFVEPNHALQLLFPADLTSSLTPQTDTAQLHVRLTGAVKLEATQTVRFVDLPTSRERTSLAGTLERVRLPPTVHAGLPILVEITARNTGKAIWLPDPPGTSGTRGVVGVGLRGWTGTDGALLPPAPNSTIHVQGTVNPGQTAILTLHTTAPSEPGHYDLILEMLSENVAWFDEVNGGARTVVPVDVQP